MTWDKGGISKIDSHNTDYNNFIPFGYVVRFTHGQ